MCVLSQQPLIGSQAHDPSKALDDDDSDRNVFLYRYLQTELASAVVDAAFLDVLMACS